MDMIAKDALEFLGILLNRQLMATTPLRLSSAQRARFNAWLHERGVDIQDKRLSGEFTIAEIIGGGEANTAAAHSPERPSVGTTMAVTPGAAVEVGLDIQSVAELTAGVNLLDLKGDAQMERLFTTRELSYAQAKLSPGETIAGLFAAKEAIRKSFGGPVWAPEQFRAIEVLPDEDGRPTFPGFSISISHSAGMAAAIACRSAGASEGATEKVSTQSEPLVNSASARAPVRRFEGLLIGSIMALIVVQLAILLLHRA